MKSINMVQKVSLTLQHLVRNLRVLFTPVNSHLIIRIFFATLKFLENYCLRRFKIVEWVKKRMNSSTKSSWVPSGSTKANGREPKICLGRVFNYKLACFNDVHVFIYVAARPRL